MVVTAVVMAALFPIGVPLVLSLILWRKRHSLYPRNKGVMVQAEYGQSLVLAVCGSRMSPTDRVNLHSQVGGKKVLDPPPSPFPPPPAP